MFLKLTLCDNDEVGLYLNFDHVLRFYGCGAGKNVWTDVLTTDDNVYSVTESCELIHRILAGGRG